MPAQTLPARHIDPDRNRACVDVAHAWPVAQLGALAGDVVALGELVPGDLLPGGPAHDTMPMDVHLLGIGATAGTCTPVTVLTALSTRRQPLRLPHGLSAMTVALVTPQALLRLFGRPLDGISDHRWSLSEWATDRDFAALCRDHAAAQGAMQRCHALASWLESLLASSRARASLHSSAGVRVAAAAAEMQQGAAAGVNVTGLAARHAMSRRQFERHFRAWIGVAPAQYRQLVRFQRAGAAVAGGAALADAALAHGYADQAHMTRSFRACGAVTPGALQRASARDARLTSALGQRIAVTSASTH